QPDRDARAHRRHAPHPRRPLPDLAGLAGADQAARVRVSLGLKWRRAAARRPLQLHAGSVFALTLLLSAGVVAWATHGLQNDVTALRPEEWLLIPALALLLASSQLAVALVNWAAGLLTRPRALPRMDFSFGIPAAARTLVVVPTMLGSEKGIEDLVEALEVRFLANRSEEHTSELQSRVDLVCRLLLEKKKENETQ